MSSLANAEPLFNKIRTLNPEPQIWMKGSYSASLSNRDSAIARLHQINVVEDPIPTHTIPL
jgi:hypothetical protein